MSEKPPRLWDRIKGWLRFWLASAAMKYCGPELIYWIDPKRWENYMDDEAAGVPLITFSTEVTVEVNEYEDLYGPEHVHDIGDL